jgi:hypothetical protein
LSLRFLAPLGQAALKNKDLRSRPTAQVWNMG